MPLIPNQLARTAVKSVTVRSTLTPDVTVDPFSADPAQRTVGAEAGPTALVLGLLRPSVYVETPAGVVPIEPYGSPDSNLAPLALAVGIAFAAGLFYLAWRGLKRRRR